MFPYSSIKLNTVSESIKENEEVVTPLQITGCNQTIIFLCYIYIY
jgi:hypothetical protein